MKAILVPAPGGPEAVVYGEAPDPVAQPGEVLVRVRAAGLNRADLLQVAGHYAPPRGASEILGLEAAGEVESSGERVFFLLPGGGYAERVSVPLGMLIPIPEKMSFVQAAAIPEAWFTAFLNLFHEAHLHRGETVLVHAAASGVGTAALQLSLRTGARVLATSRSAEKRARLLEMGARHCFEPDPATLLANLDAAIGKEGIEVALDPIGGPLFPQTLEAMAQEGRVVLIATMGGGTASVNLRTILRKRLRIIGSTLRSRRLEEKVYLTGTFRREVLPGFVDGTLAPVIDRTFPLEKAGEALARMASNENVGKIVLEVS